MLYNYIRLLRLTPFSHELFRGLGLAASVRCTCRLLAFFHQEVVTLGRWLNHSWQLFDDDELMLNVLRCHETY